MLRNIHPRALLRFLTLGILGVLRSPVGYSEPSEAPPDDAAAHRFISECSLVTTLTVGNRDAVPGSDLPFAHGTAPVAGAPYSAVGITESVMTFADGNRIIRSETSRLFRDSQGRTRIERDLTLQNSAVSLPSLEMVMINDPVSGHCYALQKWKSIAYDIPRSGNAIVVPRPPIAPPLPTAHLSTPGLDLSNTPGFESTAAYGSPEPGTQVALGEQMVDGIRTVGTRVSHLVRPESIGNEKAIHITVEQWFSPGLGLVVVNTQRSTLGEINFRLSHIRSAAPIPAQSRQRAHVGRKPRSLGFDLAL